MYFHGVRHVFRISRNHDIYEVLELAKVAEGTLLSVVTSKHGAMVSKIRSVTLVTMATMRTTVYMVTTVFDHGNHSKHHNHGRHGNHRDMVTITTMVTVATMLSILTIATMATTDTMLAIVITFALATIGGKKSRSIDIQRKVMRNNYKIFLCKCKQR